MGLSIPEIAQKNAQSSKMSGRTPLSSISPASMKRISSPFILWSSFLTMRPKRQAPNQYTVAFPGETVLQFTYSVIQLNRLPWRSYLKTPNAAASALMAKMKIASQDRGKVRNECLRMLANLQLDPARSKLIGGFIDAYLTLTAQEMKQYEREFAKLAPEEQEARMELVSSWERKGIEQQGLHEGQERIIARLIGKRFGTVASEVTERLNTLSTDQLDALTDALLDFKSVADLEVWLSRHY